MSDINTRGHIYLLPVTASKTQITNHKSIYIMDGNLRGFTNVTIHGRCQAVSRRKSTSKMRIKTVGRNVKSTQIKHTKQIKMNHKSHYRLCRQRAIVLYLFLLYFTISISIRFIRFLIAIILGIGCRTLNLHFAYLDHDISGKCRQRCFDFL